MKDQGAQLAISLSASPYNRDKQALRERLHGDAARVLGAPLVWVNQWGATDGVLFDGRSFVVDATGTVRARLAAFKPDAAVVDFGDPLMPVTYPARTRVEAYAPEARFQPTLPPQLQLIMSRLESSVALGNREEDVVLMGLIMGIREYARKTGHRRAILGLSGGADSAANAAVVALALGPDNLLTLGMKTEFTRVGSVTDANILAERYGFEYEDGSIQEEFEAYVRNNPMPRGLAAILADPNTPAGERARIEKRRTTQLENAQARIRMTRLFGRANLEGGMILIATSNKDELSNGYFTLHGDYAGGLSPLGDQGKPQVWRIMERLNELAGTDLIPTAIIKKPPSHELSANVVTTDDIPPYTVLHDVYEGYIVHGRTVEDLTREFGPIFANMPAPAPRWAGPDWVQRAIQLFERNDHKRRQEIQILRTTRKAFGYGRRVPIAKVWEAGRSRVAVDCQESLEPVPAPSDPLPKP
jgi:NAD+ synthetase